MATNEPIKLRWKMLDGGKESAYLDINVRGYKRRKEYLRIYRGGDIGRKDSREAERLALAIQRKRSDEYEKQRLGLTSTKSHRLFYPFFEELTKSDDFSQNTRGTWRSALRQLRNYGRSIGIDEESFCVCDVTPEWCDGFAEWMRTASERSSRMHGVTPKDGKSRATMTGEERLSSNSVWLYYSKLKAAMKRAYIDKLIGSDISAQMASVKRLQTHKCYLGSDEVRALMGTKCPSEQVGNAFLFSCLSGMRISDVRALRWEWVTRFAGHWRIDFSQIKTQGIMYLDISDLAYSFFGEHKNEGLIFDLPNESNCNNALRRWCKIVGINKHVTFHTSRHTAAVNMLSGGVEIYTVSKVLGHKKLATTQIYSDIVDAKKTMAVDMLASMYGASSGGTNQGQKSAKNGKKRL